MIRVRNVDKSFGERVLFRDFSIDIEDREFVVFMGESGRGKTTLLNMIGGLEPFDGGTIDVDGIDVSDRRIKRKYFGEKVGFLFQNFVLIEDKTVRYNLSLVDKKNRSDISDEDALRYVGMEDKADSKVYTLSGGEQQRVSLARLMVKKCDVILADEPTGSLDEKNARRVIEILLRLNRMGKTVIVVSHSPQFKELGVRVIEL